MLRHVRRYKAALAQQPTSTYLAHDGLKVVAVLCGLVGGTFVATSMYALGVTGTYLGD
jgi:methylene-fatty-acyl-phospholipid synthase